MPQVSPPTHGLRGSADAAPSAAWRRAIRLSLGLAAAFAATQAALVLPLLDDLPTWDQWIMAPVWHAHFEGRPVWPLLWEPYNGHVSVLPRALFYGIGLITGWDVRVEVYASYLACALTVALLLRWLGETDARLLVLAAPFAAQAFSLQQFVNFSSGFPLGQMLAQLLLTASLYALARPGDAALLPAAAAGVAASLSFASSLVLWPAGALLLLGRGGAGRVRRLAVWLACALGCGLLARSAAQGQLHPEWPRVPSFFLAVLGHPLSGRGATPEAAAWLGGALCAATALIAHLAWRAAVRERLLAWLAFGVTAPSAALVIALGRSQHGMDQAMAPHYVTAAYPLVLTALLSLGWWALARGGRGRVALLALAALSAVAQPAVVSWSWVPTLRSWSAARDVVSRALVAGDATDEQIRAAHHPQPGLVRYGVQVLRRYGLGPFRAAGPAPSTVALYEPEPIGALHLPSQLPQEGGAPCLPRAGGSTLGGWVVASRERGGPVDAVVMEIDAGVHVAQLGLPRPDVAAYFGAESFRSSGFRLVLPALGSGAHRLRVTARHGSAHAVLLDERLPACAASGPPSLRP